MRDGFGVLDAIIGFGDCQITWRRAGADRVLPFDTEEERTDYSLVVFQQRGKTLENAAISQMAPITVSSSVRTREYLTTREIERLMAAARKSSRYGHRDATPADMQAARGELNLACPHHDRPDRQSSWTLGEPLLATRIRHTE